MESATILKPPNTSLSGILLNQQYHLHNPTQLKLSDILEYSYNYCNYNLSSRLPNFFQPQQKFST